MTGRYALMAAMPLLRWAMPSAGGYPIVLHALIRRDGVVGSTAPWPWTRRQAAPAARVRPSGQAPAR